MTSEKVLITGGLGYIGSHVCVEFLNADINVLVIDNLINCDLSVVEKIERITCSKLNFIIGDIRDEDLLNKVFQENKISSVIHLAGLKAVGESCETPIRYYDYNLIGTIALLKSMNKHGCRHIVFSSSATVYGDPVFLPLTENHQVDVKNPYGRSKLIIENILQDLHTSNPEWNYGILRYFNPIGAHNSGLLGESPQGVPNNLLPYITGVVYGNLNELEIFGDDYQTPDGTGVRDYIHVEDLANAHLKILLRLSKLEPASRIINIGTGRGYSVLEIIKVFEKIANCKVPFKVSKRREGDVASCFADVTLAKKVLDWQAEHSLESMISSICKWEENRVHTPQPNDYKIKNKSRDCS